MPHVPNSQPLYEHLERLDKTQKDRLMRYAEYRAMRVRAHVRHADADDLFQEALLRTLDGRKTWNDKVDLFWHLHEAMRSIVHEWTCANYEKNCDLPKHPTAEQILYPRPERDIDSRRSAHELMRSFEAHDSEAVKVLTLLRDDYKPREIQQELDLSVTDYDRIRKRISRHGKERASRKGLYCTR